MCENISFATANSVNKYHMSPIQEQAEYNNRMKELSKHSVNIALPDVYGQEDEEGVVGFKRWRRRLWRGSWQDC